MNKNVIKLNIQFLRYQQISDYSDLEKNDKIIQDLLIPHTETHPSPPENKPARQAVRTGRVGERLGRAGVFRAGACRASDVHSGGNWQAGDYSPCDTKKE